MQAFVRGDILYPWSVGGDLIALVCDRCNESWHRDLVVWSN